MWGELKMPLHLASVGAHGEHRIGVQIIAFPCVPVLPRIARPRLASLFTCLRRGVASPLAFSGCDIVRVDKTAYAVFSTGHANDHFSFDHQRSDGRTETI